jgi:hypothetical protein
MKLKIITGDVLALTGFPAAEGLDLLKLGIFSLVRDAAIRHSLRKEFWLEDV